MQIEADMIVEGFDLLDMPEQEIWPGIWTLESVRYLQHSDGNDSIECKLNRYLPKWQWDRFEDYNNDFRWSK